MTLWDRLKEAAKDGMVLAVKWGIILLILGFLVTWAAGDYLIVRQRAYNGQLAFEAIQRAQQTQPPAQAPNK